MKPIGTLEDLAKELSPKKLSIQQINKIYDSIDFTDFFDNQPPQLFHTNTTIVTAIYEQTMASFTPDSAACYSSLLVYYGRDTTPEDINDKDIENIISQGCIICEKALNYIKEWDANPNPPTSLTMNEVINYIYKVTNNKNYVHNQIYCPVLYLHSLSWRTFSY